MVDLDTLVFLVFAMGGAGFLLGFIVAMDSYPSGDPMPWEKLPMGIPFRISAILLRRPDCALVELLTQKKLLFITLPETNLPSGFQLGDFIKKTEQDGKPCLKVIATLEDELNFLA